MDYRGTRHHVGRALLDGRHAKGGLTVSTVTTTRPGTMGILTATAARLDFGAILTLIGARSGSLNNFATIPTIRGQLTHLSTKNC